MACKFTRRDLLKRSTATLLGGSFMLAGAEEEALAATVGSGGVPAAEDLGPVPQGEGLPKGKLGDLEMSRMILGGNLIGGWAHSRDLIYVSRLFKAYNTNERIIFTLRLAEAQGINTVLLTPGEMHYIHDYNRRYGGNLLTMCQIRAKGGDSFKEVEEAANLGADTMYIQGAHADNLVMEGKMDLLVEVLERMKLSGVPCGVGAHALTVIKECERLGVESDYYVKTLHPEHYWSAHPREERVEFEVDHKRNPEHEKFHDNMWDLYPDQTIAFMKTIHKPFVAFKVLAAGAVHPREAFPFAFKNGADFIAIGMFDFQVEENVRIVRQVLAEMGGARERAWFS